MVLRLLASFPWLFAACYVLHRRLVARHSPYALPSLISQRFIVVSLSSLPLPYSIVFPLPLLALLFSSSLYTVPKVHEGQNPQNNAVWKDKILINP